MIRKWLHAIGNNILNNILESIPSVSLIINVERLKKMMP
jgi:hypothetical protein